MPSLNDFETWVRTKWMTKPFYLRNHKFEKAPDGLIRVDRAVFEFEEAQEIAKMLSSPNPIAQFTAQVAIWEKNGALVKLVLVAAIVLLVIVILFVRR